MSQNLHPAELEGLADLYRRMVQTCLHKCIPPLYPDGSMSTGEGVCVDRCVLKFFLTHEIVGQRLQKAQQELMQQHPEKFRRRF
eukprot:m.17521 g.17521  ORF g.17521 m.17521 type:complete len:84 (-) comp11279_c0_seq1:353-604(-)